MLTNDDLKDVVKRNPKFNGIEIGEMARELLTLREAVAPQMAEVDEYIRLQHWAHLELAARTAILACEREKQRADEAEKIIRELKDNFGEMEV